MLRNVQWHCSLNFRNKPWKMFVPAFPPKTLLNCLTTFLRCPHKCWHTKDSPTLFFTKQKRTHNRSVRFCFVFFDTLLLSVFSVYIKLRIKCIKVLAVQLLLSDSEHLAKMINLSKPQFSAWLQGFAGILRKLDFAEIYLSKHQLTPLLRQPKVILQVIR